MPISLYFNPYKIKTLKIKTLKNETLKITINTMRYYRYGASN